MILPLCTLLSSHHVQLRHLFLCKLFSNPPKTSTHSVPGADVNAGLCSILWQSVPQLSYTLPEGLRPFASSEPGSCKHALVPFSWCTGEKEKNPPLASLSSHSVLQFLSYIYFIFQAEEIISLFLTWQFFLCFKTACCPPLNMTQFYHTVWDEEMRTAR